MKTFTLSQLAVELDMPQKAVRAKLRKAGHERPGTRWTWPVEMKSEIKAVVKGKPAPAKKATKKGAKKAPKEAGVALHH